MAAGDPKRERLHQERELRAAHAFSGLLVVLGVALAALGFSGGRGAWMLLGFALLLIALALRMKVRQERRRGSRDHLDQTFG